MADIVHQRQHLHQLVVQPQLLRHGARDLRHFQRMREARAEMIGVAAGENLRLVLQPAKSARMNDAIAIALEVVAIRMRRLGMPPSAGLLHAKCVSREHHGILNRSRRKPRYLTAFASGHYYMTIGVTIYEEDGGSQIQANLLDGNGNRSPDQRTGSDHQAG